MPDWTEEREPTVTAPADLPDVVCLGESMVAFRPARTEPVPLAGVPSFDRGIGGAESNVACALAAAGHRAKWLGRVGADAFGDHLVAAIAAYGVDVSAVQRDAGRPTGVYFRTAGERGVGLPGSPSGSSPSGSPFGSSPSGSPSGSSPSGSPFGAVAEVLYYRAGSAASAMSPDLVRRATAWSGRILHLTGITAALSAGCLALVRGLTEPHPGRPLVSFDVNYRVALWRDAPDGPAVLAALARRCDLVFVGEDEAEAAWGVRGTAAIRAALPEPRVLVVKHGAAGATAYVRSAGEEEAAVFAPALSVDVVAPVGAGDAFAAGFLSGTLRGLSVERRLRHGHLMAAAALTSPGDLAAPPRRELADRLAALGPQEWGRLRLGPGWTEASPGPGTGSPGPAGGPGSTGGPGPAGDPGPTDPTDPTDPLERTTPAAKDRP
ncbi:sugar kinase [Streptomyces sp. URMC 124]|uniref:sugar kinase n=1 Tax=Streptomyces sp. URMC 124 TaxID=3423405 RepID=UPI003F1B7FC2